jgi:hypothetical protein
MTNEVRSFSNFTRFWQLLGYEFVGFQYPSGHRMHFDTSEYNKKNIDLLYLPEVNQETPPTSYRSMTFSPHVSFQHLSKRWQE